MAITSENNSTAIRGFRKSQYRSAMTYVVITLVVLIVVSLRKKREDQPPASLGLSYFREDR